MLPAASNIIDSDLIPNKDQLMTDLADNFIPTPPPIPDTNVEMGQENTQGP